ncbi:helix-turn-helix transcriptional regulator [Brevibacillus laterosporus]|uniref:helix-turn-helix domain-containing protein n=1 Tax=Brevibacillus laterosporus TaxID=1465 RepID=UPI00215C9083|nr:helix-turn-helix transcriptional regulator [Brevibacillus laterosporus]MCR8994694.1 helix-turn-helix transcriptional regulator [Brevibacillus laterosporus]
MKIHIKLDFILKTRKISQRELSRLTNIRFASNQMCKNDTSRITLENIAKICEVLNCDISDILELVDE